MTAPIALSKLVDDPHYQAALDVAAQIEAKLTAERATEARLVAALSARTDGAHVERAWNIVQGVAPASEEDALLAQCRQRQLVLVKGQRQQQSRLDNLRSQLSARACEAMRPEHVAAVRRVIEALRELDTANAAEREIRHAVEAAGYNSDALPPLFLASIGSITELDSPACRCIHEGEFYVGAHDNSLKGAGKVRGRALTDLPEHDAKAGEVVELPAAVAHHLAHLGVFDPKSAVGADPKVRRGVAAALARFKGVVRGTVAGGELVIE